MSQSDLKYAEGQCCPSAFICSSLRSICDAHTSVVARRTEFNERVERLITEVKAAPLAPVYEEIFYPGEPEERAEAANLHHGITLPSATLADLAALADELSIAQPV